MDIRGDVTGTLGSGIAFRDSSNNAVTPQDGVRIYDLIIENQAEHGIELPAGSVPLHIRDVRTTDVKGYGIKYTGIPISANSLHLDNLSGDNCTLALVLLQNLDDSSNVVITNIKSEGGTGRQETTITCSNCDRTSLVVNGGHNTSSTVDGSFFEAPRKFIRIIGAGCPSVVWNGFAARIRTTDTLKDTSYVLIDETVGRKFRSYNRHGSYNTKATLRSSRSGVTVADGGGSTTTVLLNNAEQVNFGDPLVASHALDMLEVIQAEPYVSAKGSVAIRFQNDTGVPFVLPATTYIKAMRVPDNYFKAKASVTYDPISIIDGASDTTAVTVPCDLGDMVLHAHATSQNSLFVTSYVDSANSVSVRWQNETGSSSDLPSAKLTVFVLKESAFRVLNSIAYDPVSLADNAKEVTTLTMEGAALGDFIVVSFSLDIQGIAVSAYVSAADTVKIVFHNFTGGIIDLASGILKVGIIDND